MYPIPLNCSRTVFLFFSCNNIHNENFVEHFPPFIYKLPDRAQVLLEMLSWLLKGMKYILSLMKTVIFDRMFHNKVVWFIIISNRDSRRRIPFYFLKLLFQSINSSTKLIIFLFFIFYNYSATNFLFYLHTILRHFRINSFPQKEARK